MNIPEFVHTVSTEQKLPGNEAVNEALIVRGMFRAVNLAELLAVFSHNTQHTLTEDAHFEGPLAIGELDLICLINRKIIYAQKTKHKIANFGYNEYPLPELTTRGHVAVNMYSLDHNCLEHGMLKPVLREPFQELDLLSSDECSIARYSAE